jgi:hypothetical protein
MGPSHHGGRTSIANLKGSGTQNQESWIKVQAQARGWPPGILRGKEVKAFGCCYEISYVILEGSSVPEQGGTTRDFFGVHQAVQ